MNFSTSNIWNNSFILRYPLEQIKKIGNLYFYESENILTPHILEALQYRPREN